MQQLFVFDANDREVVPERELERFWTVDNNAGIYKPQYQDRAHRFTLRPGSGVHIPVNWPHWLRNGSDVSVSVSINFQFRDKTRGHIYRTNYLMRKLGLNPTSPGVSPWRDRLKSGVAWMAYYGADLARGHWPPRYR